MPVAAARGGGFSEPLPSFELPPVSLTPQQVTKNREVFTTDRAPPPPISKETREEREEAENAPTLPPEEQLSEADIEAIEVVDDLDAPSRRNLALVPEVDSAERASAAAARRESAPGPFTGLSARASQVDVARASDFEGPASATGVDLEGVETLAPLDPPARQKLARFAKVQHISKGKHVGGFAMALIVVGEADVSAPLADTSAQRLKAGSILRIKGTLGDSFPLRLVAATDEVAIATWDAAVTDAAFEGHTKLDQELRRASDRIQARVAVSMGPLAERLDPSLREMFLNQLDVRALAPFDTLVDIGKPVPGILLVATGEVELLVDDQVRGVVSSGEFVFANEVLGGGKAPHMARAGATGALVLHAGRMAAQELLVTCPPLLDISRACNRVGPSRRGSRFTETLPSVSDRRRRSLPSEALRCPPRPRSEVRTIARLATPWGGHRPCVVETIFGRLGASRLRTESRFVQVRPVSRCARAG